MIVIDSYEIIPTRTDSWPVNSIGKRFIGKRAMRWRQHLCLRQQSVVGSIVAQGLTVIIRE